eukprot:scaffold72974_cov18-Tisochrysis_lutea.AAC.1
MEPWVGLDFAFKVLGLQGVPEVSCDTNSWQQMALRPGCVIKVVWYEHLGPSSMSGQSVMPVQLAYDRMKGEDGHGGWRMEKRDKCTRPDLARKIHYALSFLERWDNALCASEAYGGKSHCMDDTPLWGA